jgi:hypothetical protein
MAMRRISLINGAEIAGGQPLAKSTADELVCRQAGLPAAGPPRQPGAEADLSWLPSRARTMRSSAENHDFSNRNIQKLESGQLTENKRERSLLIATKWGFALFEGEKKRMGEIAIAPCRISSDAVEMIIS